jgi:hypothetical protein
MSGIVPVGGSYKGGGGSRTGTYQKLFSGGLFGGIGQKRTYEMCMVFKYKTSKHVKFEENMQEDVVGRKLEYPTEKATTTMLMWKQRREGILKSLENCGLHIYCYYSRDRDQIICKIGAHNDKLRDTAARMKYKLQLKSEYLNAYGEFRHDFAGRPELNFTDRRIVGHLYKTHANDESEAVTDDAIFAPLDKISLVHHIITSKDKDCAGIQVDNLIHQEDLVAYFPLHDSAALKDVVGSHWDWFLMGEEHTNKVREYFGDKIGFYFLFASQYCLWLVPIAAIGLFLQLLDVMARTPDNFTASPFCVLLSIWSIMLPHFWKREEAKRAISWGSLDADEKLEPYRPQHWGEPRLNPVTAQVEPFFNPADRVRRYVFSGAVTLLSGTATMMVILLLIFLRHLEKNYINGGIAAMQLYTAIAVELMNAIMSLVAMQLTRLENHRTQNEHDTAQLAKVVCFKFINSYAALYYIAFFKNHESLFGTKMRCIRGDCLLDLQSQLGIFVVLRIFVALTYEYLRPRFAYMYRSYLLEGQSLMNVIAGRSRLEVADMSKAEKQSRDDKFESFGEFDQVLVTHGYATLFAVSSPWVCAATLFACVLGIWLDKTKLLTTKQRPLPQKARSIEPWDTAFEVYGILAAATNLFLLIFTSQQYMLWSFTEKLTYFVFLEHWILISRLVVNQVFPVVPRSVQFLQLKQEAMVHRCLENIKVEAVADLSMFRDQKIDEYDVFECDTLEEDMEDMQEPELNLGHSGRTMYEGIKEQVSRNTNSRPYPSSPVVSRP